MAAKDETVFPFQEIVLDQCGFKPKIAASLTWSYTASSVQTKHGRTSQRYLALTGVGNEMEILPRESVFAPAQNVSPFQNPR